MVRGWLRKQLSERSGRQENDADVTVVSKDTFGATAWVSVRGAGEWRLRSPPGSWVGGRAKGEGVGMVRAYKIIFNGKVL